MPRGPDHSAPHAADASGAPHPAVWHASGTAGAVAAGSAHAAEAARDVLREGGNAADAAVTATLSLAVTDYGMFAFGGEVAALYAEAATGAVVEISGLGTAPIDPVAIRAYEAEGIPDQGSLLATLPPGAPDFCFTTLERFGTISFARAAEPTLALLDRGVEPWHPALARTWRRLIAAERKGADRRGGLAAARDAFARGPIAADLARFYAEHGHRLTARDLAAHRTRIGPPVRIAFGDVEVVKCGPWTQGPVLAQTLRLLEARNIGAVPWLSADAVHLAVEALKLALADRDAYYADPRRSEVPLDALLSSEYAAVRAALIDPDAASREVRPGDPRGLRALRNRDGRAETWEGGTTVCVVADRAGNVAAVTPSANPPYTVCESLGIAHGNRLRCLNTTPGHPNRIAPGKRPRITLTPTLWLRDGRAAGALSVAGGDLQDQTTLCCLLGHLLAGYSPAEAVTAPRFSTAHHEDSFRSASNRADTRVGLGRVTLDEVLRVELGAALEQRGHTLCSAPGPLARPAMLTIGADGTIAAAGDPRTRLHAAAV